MDIILPDGKIIPIITKVANFSLVFFTSLQIYKGNYHMAGKNKYWKISLVVMVITCENIRFITSGHSW